MADLVTGGAEFDRLDGVQRDEQCREHAEARECRQVRHERHEGDQYDGRGQPVHLEPPEAPPREGDVRQQVQRGAAVHGPQRRPVQRVRQRVVLGVTHVGEDLLEAQGQHHDADHHRQVQVGEGGAGHRHPLLALHAGERVLAVQGRGVEVGPPHARRHREPQDRGDHDRPRDRQVGDTHTYGHDRLAERHDHDEPVPFGEVPGGVQPPAAGADDEACRRSRRPPRPATAAAARCRTCSRRAGAARCRRPSSARTCRPGGAGRGRRR